MTSSQQTDIGHLTPKMNPTKFNRSADTSMIVVQGEGRDDGIISKPTLQKGLARSHHGLPRFPLSSDPSVGLMTFLFIFLSSSSIAAPSTAPVVAEESTARSMRSPQAPLVSRTGVGWKRAPGLVTPAEPKPRPHSV